MSTLYTMNPDAIRTEIDWRVRAAATERRRRHDRRLVRAGRRTAAPVSWGARA